MEKEFIPYEQAVTLKELGFDEPCLCYYEDNKIRIFEQSEYDEILVYRESECVKDIATCFAPLCRQAFRWFREKYNYWNYIFPNIHQKDWNYHIQYYDVNEIWGETYIKGNFKTYEEAELECLKKLIEIVKNK